MEFKVSFHLMHTATYTIPELLRQHLDVNECIKEVGCNAPFITARVGSADSMEIKLVVEIGNILNMPSLSMALCILYL